jgi:pyocin large subunit-like protein
MHCRISLVALLALLAFGVFPASATPKDHGSSNNSKVAHLKGPPGKPIWSGPGEQNARDHFQKHGAEFGHKSAQEYVDAAHSFTSKPPSGTLTKKRPNGDKVFYHPASNTFAIADGRGAPRTMFKPDKKRAYYEAQ